jgi:anti-anti-sigma regulatory factor
MPTLFPYTTLFRSLEHNAAKFVLCSLGGHVRELFEMGGLLEAFTIHPSRAEAVAKMT